MRHLEVAEVRLEIEPRNHDRDDGEEERRRDETKELRVRETRAKSGEIHERDASEDGAAVVRDLTALPECYLAAPSLSIGARDVSSQLVLRTPRRTFGSPLARRRASRAHPCAPRGLSRRRSIHGRGAPRVRRLRRPPRHIGERDRRASISPRRSRSSRRIRRSAGSRTAGSRTLSSPMERWSPEEKSFVDQIIAKYEIERGRATQPRSSKFNRAKSKKA